MYHTAGIIATVRQYHIQGILYSPTSERHALETSTVLCIMICICDSINMKTLFLSFFVFFKDDDDDDDLGRRMRKEDFGLRTQFTFDSFDS